MSRPLLAKDFIMRILLIAVVTLAVSLLQPATANAQKPQKTRINDVRVGFRAGRELNEPMAARQYLFKSGMWTPVWVDITAGDDGFSNGELVVEATDSDEVQNNYIVPVPPLAPRTSFTALSYTRTGSSRGDLVVTVRNEAQSDAFKKAFEAIELDELLFLTLGGSLTGLRQSLLSDVEAGNKDNPNEQPVNANRPISRGYVAHLSSIEALPTRWYGYAPIDLLILTTGDVDFVTNLLNPREKARQEALSEWIRRGGRLVLSTGRNQHLAGALLPVLMHTAPVKIVAGGMQARSLPQVEDWAKPTKPKPFEAPKDKPIELARLDVKTGQSAEVLIRPLDGENQPLAVSVPYGMGQVTVVAFDLDLPPFTRWEGQTDFWKKMREAMGAGLIAQENRPQYTSYGMNQASDLASKLRDKLEEFPDVSNISFGWVALFILIYILIVGPLDYFFLKKVVKRLELTWITFPTVVLLVSVIAYFTAYSLKGNDLLINKADLVDIDLEGQMSYGHTWFTLFSPRIQHYTLGVEPAAPTWAAEARDPKAPSAVLSWMGRPDASFGGYGRPRSQSLFRRAYQYAPDAAGLEGVPIQVWSMKSFEASWERPLTKPPFSANIQRAGAQKFQGTLTNHLPVALEDACLIYGGGPAQEKVYLLDKPLRPGIPETIHFIHSENVTTWAGASPQAGNLKEDIFKRLLFYERFSDNNKLRNVSLRTLDESWRLNLKDEVVLYGRLPHEAGSAETLTAGAASTSRLWLGKLPAPGAKRPELLGNMKQDTYVRVFIPLKP